MPRRRTSRRSYVARARTSRRSSTRSRRSYQPGVRRAAARGRARSSQRLVIEVRQAPAVALDGAGIPINMMRAPAPRRAML